MFICCNVVFSFFLTGDFVCQLMLIDELYEFSNIQALTFFASSDIWISFIFGVLLKYALFGYFCYAKISLVNTAIFVVSFAGCGYCLAVLLCDCFLVATSFDLLIAFNYMPRFLDWYISYLKIVLLWLIILIWFFFRPWRINYNEQFVLFLIFLGIIFCYVSISLGLFFLFFFVFIEGNFFLKIYSENHYMLIFEQ